MIALILLVILTVLAFYKDSLIRKHSVKLYIILTVLAVLALLKSDIVIFKPIIQGFMGLALFYLVMIAGALPKSKLQKKLMSIRREFSIIGFIVITPHGLHYILEAINGERTLAILGVIAYAIMIPLFITSFKAVRKKMTIHTWRKLQSAAYVVYILLSIHLLLNYTLTINLVLYIVLFGVYYFLKAKKELMKSKKKVLLDS